jgi:hypothetical protein
LRSLFEARDHADLRREIAELRSAGALREAAFQEHLAKCQHHEGV